MQKKNVDFTKGNSLPQILLFSIPLVAGALFQQLYSFVDIGIVGRGVSTDALTAVGITGGLNFLILGLAMGAAMGFCIPLAQSIGSRQQDETGRYFFNGLYLSALLGLLLTGLAVPLLPAILRRMHTPDKLFAMTETYYRIILFGLITTTLYNYLSGVIRSFGDSKRPFVFLVISSVLNLILDCVMILRLQMGVAGAAIATVISQAVSVLLCAWYLFCKMRAVDAVSDGHSLTGLSAMHVKRLCAVGIPMGLAYSFAGIGSVALQSSINTLGSVAAAGQTCGEKIRMILTIPSESVGMAVSTYVAQNYGAKDFRRIREGIRSGLLIEAGYSALAWALLFVLKRTLVGILLGTTVSAEAELAVYYLSAISMFFIFLGSLMVFRHALQGMGHSTPAMLAGGFEIIGRVIGGKAAVAFSSFTLICAASPLGWLLAALYCMMMFSYYMRKHKIE